ncbi:MAG: hypothetical protein LBP64_11200 [Tannerella sp.]|nr:hypothetical protein [Tannerella sp.]
MNNAIFNPVYSGKTQPLLGQDFTLFCPNITQVEPVGIERTGQEFRPNGNDTSKCRLYHVLLKYSMNFGWDISHVNVRFGDVAQPNDSAAVENGSAPVENDSASWEKDSATCRNNSAPVGHGFALRKNGSATCRNGSAPARNDSASQTLRKASLSDWKTEGITNYFTSIISKTENHEKVSGDCNQVT